MAKRSLRILTKKDVADFGRITRKILKDWFPKKAGDAVFHRYLLRFAWMDARIRLLERRMGKLYNYLEK